MKDNKKITTLIVDDEDLARLVLRELVQTHPELTIAAECANGFEAVKAVAEHKPDLIFLDVQMPKLSGFEVMELLGERAPAVIFVTAHDEFAVQAFQIHAVDYLLKPVEPERLQQALQRARERLRDPAPDRAAASARIARAARPPGQWLERVVIRDGTRVHVLAIHTVDFIEAEDDYLVIAAGGKRYRKQQTLAQLETQLDPSRFVRIHRSFVLNVERIARIEPYAKDSWQIFLSDGSHLPMSRSGYQRLRTVLD
jgi:two-component system LytT family response regulator